MINDGNIITDALNEKIATMMEHETFLVVDEREREGRKKIDEKKM